MSASAPTGDSINLSDIESNADLVAQGFMDSAEIWIDQQFGAGFAAKHPDAVVGFMLTAKGIYQADLLQAALGRLGDDLRSGLKDIARELQDLTAATRDGAKGSHG